MPLLSHWVLGGRRKRAHRCLPKETISLPNKQLELCYGCMSSLWLCPGTQVFCHYSWHLLPCLVGRSPGLLAPAVALTLSWELIVMG